MGHRGNSSWCEWALLSAPSSYCIPQWFSRRERDTIGWWHSIEVYTNDLPTVHRAEGASSGSRSSLNEDTYRTSKEIPMMARRLHGRHVTVLNPVIDLLVNVYYIGIRGSYLTVFVPRNNYLPHSLWSVFFFNYLWLKIIIFGLFTWNH